MVQRNTTRPTTTILTPRDEVMLADIYLTRYLTAEQLAAMYFLSEDKKTHKRRPSVAAANRRLQRLARDGWVIAHKQLQASVGVTYKLWALGDYAFERERELLEDDPGAKPPTRPSLANLEHRIGVGDIYRDCSYALRLLIGEPTLESPLPAGAWSWYYEGKLERTITLAGSSHKLKPDAEIHTPDTIFFVEYQTEASRIGSAAMKDKVSNYANYINHVLPRITTKQSQLIVPTDAGWVVDATNTKARETALPTRAGSVHEVTEHIISELGKTVSAMDQ